MCGFLKPLVILVSFVLLWFGAKVLRERQVMEEGSALIERDASPVSYWSTVAIYIGCGLAGILFSLIFL